MQVSRGRINAAANAALEGGVAALAAGASPERCAALCEHTNATLEREFARFAAEGSPVACAQGCSFCCHHRVSVLPHEALALWHALRTELPAPLAAVVTSRIREHARRVDAMTVAEHYAANLPCAFLVDGVCSVYARRPSVCASFHSMSRARCEESFNRPEGIGTPRNRRPVLLDLQGFADAVIEATGAAVSAAGLDARKVELHQAVRALLDDPDAARRWGAGGTVRTAGAESPSQGAT